MVKLIKMNIPDLDENGAEQWEYKTENGEMVMAPVFMNSHNYLIWLVKNNKAGLVQLLSGYMLLSRNGERD